MRFHITYSPLGTLLSYHLRQSLSATHSICLLYKTRAQAQASAAAGNIVRVEHASMIMTARNIRSEAMQYGADRSYTDFAKTSSKTITKITEDESTPIDSLIITDLPTYTFKILQRLVPRLSPTSTIILMHSGLGVYERIISDLFPNPQARPHFILANSRHELWQKDHNHAVHTHVGSIIFSIIPDPKGRNFEASLQAPDIPKIGRSLVLRDIAMPPDDPHLAEYATLYNSVAALRKLTHLHVSWIPMAEAEVMIRHEVVVRSIVEALGVWLNCRNGEIFKTAEARKLGQAMCREAAAAFRAQWHAGLRSTMSFSSTASLPGLPVGLTAKDLMSDCIRLVLGKPNDVTPMLRDISVGTRTQVGYGLGYLLDIARTYSVHVPVIRTVCMMIRARESLIRDP